MVTDYVNCINQNGENLEIYPGIKFLNYSRIDGYTILSIDRIYFEKYREKFLGMTLSSKPTSQTIFIKISGHHKNMNVNILRTKKLERILNIT
jgi:hypothetical protein